MGLPGMIPTIEEVAIAYIDCRKRKRNTASATAFEQGLAGNLAGLHRDLVDRSYKIGVTRCFAVTNPKPREVWAGAFRDRVVHHVLYNRIAPEFHRSFSAASCACIPGRGTLYGAKRLEKQVRSATQNWTKDVRYLKLDLSNFFVSIHKPTLHDLLRPKLHDDWTRWICETILFHDPTSSVDICSASWLMALVPSHKSLFNAKEGCGLPIGNLSSQFFANVYMNALDQFVDHQIKPRGYIRYVDDFILLHESPQFLLEAKARIEVFLREELRAEINPTKTVLQRVDRGIDFVGQVIKPWHRVPRGTLVHAAMRKIESADDADSRRSSANSYLGLLRQVSAHSARAAISKRMMMHGHPVDAKFTRAFAQTRQEPQCAT